MFYNAHCGIRTDNPTTQKIQDVNAAVRAPNVMMTLRQAGLQELQLDP